MIEFIDIKIKNFRSYGNKVSTFTFKEGFDLISASNGAGKSSLIQSITYALFGKIPKMKISELINNHNKKNLYIELTFKSKNSIYVIHRGEKPKIFSIFKDGVLIDTKSRNLDYQEMLEKEIINISLQSFQMLVSLDTTLLNKSFITMNTTERRDFLENILDIKVLYFINQIITTKLKMFKTNEVELNFKIKSRKEILLSEEQKYNDILRINKELQDDNHEHLLAKENKKMVTQEKIEKYIHAFDKIEKQVILKNELKISFEILKNKISTLKEQYQTVNTSITTISTIKDTSVDCKKCGYNSYTSEKDLELTLIEEQSNKDKLKGELLITKTELEHITSKLSKCTDIINKKASMTSNRDHLIESLHDLERDIAKTKSFKMLPEDNTRIIELKTEIKLYEGEYSSLVKNIDIHSHIKSIVSDDGIKKSIFERYIPLFNKHINEILPKFNISYNVIFDSKFNVDILDRGVQRSFYTLSASEKMRVNLCVIFAFSKILESKNSSSINLMVFDEILDNALSPATQELVLNYIKYNITNKNILVISHNPVLNTEMFDRTFMIEKINGFSNLSQV